MRSITSLLHLTTTLLALVLLPSSHAHAGHEQAPLAADADWSTRHMSEEHHINSFDAGSFFNLHDYSSSGQWGADDIQKTYGLKDVSNKHVTASQRREVSDKILSIYDADRSGTISFAEFTVGSARGLSLPDLGYGPGHHGDDEYEYEIHHFEKFHDENTKEEDLVHPEDIAHFKHHDELEAEQERIEAMDKMKVVEGNIPGKFRRRRG